MYGCMYVQYNTTPGIVADPSLCTDFHGSLKWNSDHPDTDSNCHETEDSHHSVEDHHTTDYMTEKGGCYALDRIENYWRTVVLPHTTESFDYDYNTHDLYHNNRRCVDNCWYFSCRNHRTRDTDSDLGYRRKTVVVLSHFGSYHKIEDLHLSQIMREANSSHHL